LKGTFMGTLIVVVSLVVLVAVGVVLFMKNNPKKAAKINEVVDVLKKK
jgi:nitrate/nitrite transporter NarK